MNTLKGLPRGGMIGSLPMLAPIHGIYRGIETRKGRTK